MALGVPLSYEFYLKKCIAFILFEKKLYADESLHNQSSQLDDGENKRCKANGTKRR